MNEEHQPGQDNAPVDPKDPQTPSAQSKYSDWQGLLLGVSGLGGSIAYFMMSTCTFQRYLSAAGCGIHWAYRVGGPFGVLILGIISVGVIAYSMFALARKRNKK
jgi:hypothetical protein